MGLFRQRAVERRRDGRYVVRLDEDARRLLASLPGQLAALVDEAPDDPWLERLFPTAYPEDPDRQAEWALLMQLDLHARRKAQLATLATTAEQGELTEEEALGWAQALNDLRLYLGTRLEVTEDMDLDDLEDEDDRQLFVLYAWLGALQDDVISALSSGL
jgi:hypothetical protein